MNTEYLHHDLKQSFLLIVTQERRLLAGLLGGLVLYALWVGTTAAALEQFAEFATLSTTLDPWTSDTTGLAAVGVILWVILPAVVAGYGVNRAVTNSHGYLAKPYRLRHPATLLVAPLVVVLCGFGALVVLSDGYRGAVLLLLVGTVFFHIRVLPYSYRVFSVSTPRLVAASFVLTGAVVSTALLVEGAIAAGQSTVVDAVGAGLASVLGIEALGGIGGTTTLAGIAVPTMLGLAAATPLVLGGLYLLFQAAIGGINRLQSPTVARTEIRTGQRYPEFAKPTVAPSERTQISTTTTTRQKSDSPDSANQGSGIKSATQEAEQPETEGEDEQKDQDEGEDEESTTDDEESVDDVSHTKVFRPPGEEES